jgi:hypothetical protein
MATYTSTQAGPWSSLNTWGGSGPPVAADSVIILHAVTYDATLVHTAGVTVRGAGVLSLQADLKLLGTAILRLDVAGGVCGRIVAAGAPRTIWFMGGTTYQIQGAGTSAAHGAMQGENATNTLAIDGSANVDVFRGGGMIDATFIDFINCGSATVPALKAYAGASNVGPYRLIDCTFTNCGRIYIDKLGPNSVFTLLRVKHLSPPGASKSLYLAINQGVAPNAGINRSITACAFDALAEVYTANGLVGRDIYAGNEFYSHFDGIPDLQRIFFNKPVGTVDSICFCPITDWYIFEADPTPTNAHWIFPTPGYAPNPYVVQGVIFDGNQPAVHPQNGDCYNSNGQGTGTVVMKNCLVLPTAWGPTEAGTLMSLGGNANITFSIEHNTYCAGYQGGAVGESYAGYTGMVTSFRSNFAWNDPTLSRGFKLYDSGYDQPGGDNNVPDLVTAANCDYNGGWNVSSGGSNGKGYHALEFTSGSPGAHDVDVNPLFVDYARDFLSWDASLGGAGTVASAQARLKADPTLIGTSLIPYVRAGFAPQNPLLATAAHDGTTIGAVPYLAPASDYTIFPPAPASGVPGSASAAFTVSLKAGFNPGATITITPHTTGLAGTFTPATVTLSNTTRSATFTFTPTVSTTGTATITVTNSGTLADPNPVTYTASYPPLDLTKFNADIQKIGRSYPKAALFFDGDDHYDPTGVFENILAYSNDPTWTKQISFAVARTRGYLEDQGGFQDSVHLHNEGFYQHYVRTGDPLSRDMAILAAAFGAFAGDAYDLNGVVWQGLSREVAFTLRNQLIAERLGVAHRTRTDDWASTAIDHLNQWGATNRPWAVYSRPFMFGLTASALAWYWDRYRDARIPVAMKAALDWFWANAWDPASQQFYYTAEDTNSWVTAKTTLQASPAPTSTSFAGGTGLSSVDDAYKGVWVIRTKLGVLEEQGRICSGYNGTTKVFTFSTPWDLTTKPTYAWQAGEGIFVADDIKVTVQASPAPTTTSFALGGTGLSSLADYYRFAAMIMPGGGIYQCWSYNGTTKVFTTRPGVALPSPPVAGSAVSLSRYQKNGFNLGGFTGGQGIGAGGDLNLMIAHAYYWYYWYSVLTGQRDNTYRARGDQITLGNVSPANQKQYNEAYKFSFWGLKWRGLGDSPPAAATALTLTAPSPASGKANAPSGLFFAALASGGVSSPVTVTPADGGAGGTFNPATVVLTTDRPSAHFRYIPPASKDGQSVTIAITNDGGLTNPAGRSYAVSGTAPLATGYTITATGAPRGPNQYSAPFTVALTPAGAVPPRAADARGCLITLASFGGAIYPLRNVSIAADRPTTLIAFEPDTAAATNTARLQNDAGLTNAPNIAYTAGTALPLATASTLTAPSPASGPVGSPSAPFTVALPAGTAVAKGSSGYWVADIVPNDGTGGGTFNLPQLRITPTQFSTTFAYTPSTGGTKTIATTNTASLTNPASVLYNATTSAATGFTLTAPSPASGTVGVASGNFTVALVPAGATSADVTITPAAGAGGGTFAPATLTLNTNTPSGTFKYTPASAGTKTIAITNNGGLTNPAGVTYSAIAAPPVATGYSLAGPSPASGTVGVASGNFTVALTPTGGTSAAVTVTPTDGTGGGTFTPSTVTLSTATPTATFKYTPATAGTATITTTNSGTLTNPAGIAYSAAAVVVAATGFTLTAPTPASGQIGIASTNFTVALTPTGGTSAAVTIIPAATGAGGTFTPSTVTLSTATPIGTFRFTPTSAGTATITTTNSGNYANPAGITYTATPSPTPTPTPTSAPVKLRIRPRTGGKASFGIRAH